MIKEVLEEKKEYLEKKGILYSLESQKKYEGLDLVETHCIDAIKKLDRPNITNIALKMKMTKSGITKMATKLVFKGFLEKYKLENNKKEVYFSLTEMGERVYLIHDKRHSILKAKDIDLLSSFSDEELIIINKFFRRSNEFLDREIVRVEHEIESKKIK